MLVVTSPLMFLRALFVGVFAFSTATAFAQPSVVELLLQRTEQHVRDYVHQQDGVIGVTFTDFATGKSYGVNRDVLFPQASSIKIPIMMRVFQAEREGAFRLTDAVKFTPRDLVGGSGNLKAAITAGPMEMPLLDVVIAMIQHSDNSATNKCIALVGMDRVNQMLDEMGFPRTRLRRVMIDQEAIRAGRENSSTPDEMARMAEQLWRSRVIDEAACRQMLEILQLVKGPMRDALPDGVAAATKTGGLPGVNCQSGVILLEGRPFALSVMTTFSSTGQKHITEITRIVFAAFDKLARSNEWGRTVRQTDAP
ncbi:MAG: serine hydrolase [Candidatus Didemnitutus sp.]|nr:serine hydrolase [Candidatus Didemnitutus sp.]